MEYKVYCFSALGINYVGQSKNLEERWKWKGYNYKRNNQKIYKAAYGFYGDKWWDWMNKKVICRCGSKKQADLIETYHILKRNSVKQGQNCNLGNGLKWIFPQGYDIEWIYDNREDVMEMLAAEAWESNITELTDFNFE